MYSKYFKAIDIRGYFPCKKIKFRIGNKFYSSEQFYYHEIDNKILFTTQRHFNNLKNKYFNSSAFIAGSMWLYIDNKKSAYFKTQYDIINIVGSYKYKDYTVFCDMPLPKFIAALAKKDHDFAINKLLSFAPYMDENEANEVIKKAKGLHRAYSDF